MKSLRKIPILLVNAVVLLLLGKVVLFDRNDVGYSIVSVIFLFVFNIYALILYKYFWKNPRKLWYLEAAYLVVLLVPTVLIKTFTIIMVVSYWK